MQGFYGYEKGMRRGWNWRQVDATNALEGGDVWSVFLTGTPGRDRLLT
jgi:hypothetical protein